MKPLVYFSMVLVCASAHAEMPLPLMDNDPTSSSFLPDVAAEFQAVLECRKPLDLSNPKIRALLATDASSWEITPPKSFRVFGLPVELIEVFIDPTGEMGASYSSQITAPVDRVSEVIKLKAHKASIGYLMASEGQRPSLAQLTCTVPGSVPQDGDE